MELKNNFFWFLLIACALFVASVAEPAFSGKAFAAASKTRTYTGHVDFIHKSKIVIDDFEMQLATGTGGVKKGSYVQFSIDSQGRVVKIKDLGSAPDKSRRSGRKNKPQKNYNSKAKGPITKAKRSGTSSSKLKKRNGVWRNY